MLINVIKTEGDISKPDAIEMDTKLKIGDRFTMQYDWCSKICGINGNKVNWHIGTAEFTVSNMVCNMLLFPHEIWVRLHTQDSDFKKRCGCNEFDAPERQVLERVV